MYQHSSQPPASQEKLFHKQLTFYDHIGLTLLVDSHIFVWIQKNFQIKKFTLVLLLAFLYLGVYLFVSPPFNNFLLIFYPILATFSMLSSEKLGYQQDRQILSFWPLFSLYFFLESLMIKTHQPILTRLTKLIFVVIFAIPKFQISEFFMNMIIKLLSLEKKTTIKQEQRERNFKSENDNELFRAYQFT